MVADNSGDTGDDLGESGSWPDAGPTDGDLTVIPEGDDLDTARDEGDPPDLAAGALAAARAIASGQSLTQGDQSGRSGGRRPGGPRRRRRSGPDAVYSGARSDPRDPASIGAIVGEAVEKLGWVGPIAEGRLLGQWESVVGSDIASHCQPVSLIDGQLKITAESTAWATQLRLLAPQLLARIAAEVPAGMVKLLVISGPSGPSFKRGPWSVRGRGVRDTYG